jgi:hypothetical protein
MSDVEVKWYKTIHKQKFILAMFSTILVCTLTGMKRIDGADCVSAVIWINAIMGGWNVASKVSGKLDSLFPTKDG